MGQAFTAEAISASAPLPPQTLAGAALVVLACPQRRLARTEIAALRGVVSRGGSLLVLASAGGDRAAGLHPWPGHTAAYTAADVVPR